MVCRCILLVLSLLSFVPSLSLAQSSTFKAVNLGNWLVTEGWMKPSLFNDIPNKDLLDGTKVQFKSTKFQKYLAAEKGGGAYIAADRTSASDWETFRLWRINETYFHLRVSNKNFVGLSARGNNRAVAVADTAGEAQTFQIVRNANNANLVRLKASNNQFLQVQSDTLVTADNTGTGWDQNDASVFEMKNLGGLQGEYQITNGYGPERALQVLQNHRNTYVTEEDFIFLSRNGLNAVRVPVGWWIASDPTPPKPFVGGSLQALDNAFTWAQKHNMKVIVDLHAVKDSQNGNEHSGTRDGFQEWGDSSIPDTVAVIDFLAKRYGNNPSLGAIELINEPTAPGVTLEALRKYYQAGYDTVRKYTNAPVILSNRLGPADRKELLSFASTLNSVVIDVHYYSMFEPKFSNMNAQQSTDYIYNERSKELSDVSNTNGVKSFVGEWTGEWAVQGASMAEYNKFNQAQLQVYGKASFGWAYWSYKCANNKWSLKWMIENNYIKIN